MRFGFMESFRNPVRWRRPWASFYQDILDQIARNEELGYDNVWLTEHHFTEDGYNPSIATAATAIAIRTERIRVGSFVMLLPYQHPVLVAEEVTNIDIFSNGRFELGVGQGYVINEFETLCINRKERGARLREGIEIVERILNEDNVTVDGKFTQVKNATICPKPIQNPLPIWIGARGPRAIKFAAAHGYHLMATLGPDPVPLYRESLEASGRDPAQFKVAQLRMSYCADSDDQAWEESQEHLFHILDFYQGVLAEAADVEGDDQILTVEKPEDLRDSPIAEHLLIGSPATITQKFEDFLAGFACTDFIMETQMPGIEPAKANRSFELFAKEVMPKFRDA